MAASIRRRPGGDRASALFGPIARTVGFAPIAYSLAVLAWLAFGVLLFGAVLLLGRVIGVLYGLLPSTVGPLATPVFLVALFMLLLVVFSPKRRFIVTRLLAMIVVAFLIATLVFILVHASPYDPVRLVLGQHAADPRLVATLRHQFGLDVSLWQQYMNFIGGLLHGHLGYSIGTGTLGQPVWDIIKTGLPQSLKLGGYALLLALYIGLPVGLMSALKQNSLLDHGSQSLMIVFYAVPSFVIAPVCQLIFGVQLKWLPVTGWGDPGFQGTREMILPVLIFALGIAAYLSKSFRSFMLEILSQDYVRTARAKGLKERTVIYLHAGKNALLPLASIVGPLIAFLVVGAFIIELFFGIPGIGYATVAAVTGNDGPLIEGTTLLLALAVVFVNMLTDIVYGLVDPRVKN